MYLRGMALLCALLAGVTVVLALQLIAHADEGLQPGGKAPSFSLTATDGKVYTLDEYLKQGRTVVLEWFNPDCPWVKRFHDSAGSNNSLRDAYKFANSEDMVWLAINSSAVGKQGAGIERNKLATKEYAIAYPVLLDEQGVTGRAYGALTTPTLFIISKKGVVLYRGGVDDTKTNADRPSVNLILTALKQVAAGVKVDPAVTPHYGCSVKYAD